MMSANSTPPRTQPRLDMLQAHTIVVSYATMNDVDADAR